MKIFEAQDIRIIDKETIEDRNIASINLMEEAAISIFKVITSMWPVNTKICIWAGVGNNGGDGLAVARLLISKGYNIKVYLWNPKNRLSKDCRINLSRLDQNLIQEISEETEFDKLFLPKADLYIDSFFGSGLNRPIEGHLAKLIKAINNSNTKILSIDIPSGLMLINDTEAIIRANYTLTIDRPKLQFFFPENHKYIGDLLIAPLNLSQSAIHKMFTNYHLITESNIRKIFQPRSLFDHKGKFGHTLIVAGSRGMSGASILSGKGALRSGVGLLSIAVPSCNRIIVQTSLPEAMLIEIGDNYIGDSRDDFISNINKFKSIIIGPGIGQNEEGFLFFKKLLDNIKVPIVLDADGLNYLSKISSKEQKLPKGSILTPHLKELERLIGKVDNHFERIQKTLEFCRRLDCYVIIKGKYSVVVDPNGMYYFNSTGNPGMATGGSGDILSGIISSLLAQGYTSFNAAILGVYLHGKAGDIARDKYGETSLIASDIINNLSEAFINIEKK